MLVSVSHTIYVHLICCQFLLISYWIPHWLLFDVLYTFLFLYVHSCFWHRWSANPSSKLWSISTKTSILCVVNVGSSRLIWAVVYCNVCNRLMPCCFGRISFAIWIVWNNDCVLNTCQMEPDKGVQVIIVVWQILKFLMCGINFVISMTSGTNLIGGTSGKKRTKIKYQ